MIGNINSKILTNSINFIEKYEKISIPVIYLLALIIRLVYVWITGFNTYLDSDSIEYVSYANNLIAGKGYTDGKWLAFRPPGYPFFIAGVFLIFGKSITWLKIIQIIISSFIPVIIYLIGKKLFSKKLALTAGIFACFYFGLYQEPAHIMSESIWTFLLMLAILTILKSSEKKTYIFLAGIFFAMNSFTRPVGLLFTGAGAIWLTIKFYKKEALKTLSIFFLGFIVFMLPWWIRNYKIFNTFVPVCLETGFVFKHTHLPAEIAFKKVFENDYLSEVERDKKNFEDGLKCFKSMNSTQLLKRWLTNLSQLLYPFTPTYDLSYMLIFPFWIYGTLLILKSQNIDIYVPLSMFMYFPVAMFFVGVDRYRHSIGGLIILISFTGINKLIEKGNKKYFYLVIFWLLINLIVFFYSEFFRDLVRFIGWKILK